MVARSLASYVSIGSYVSVARSLVSYVSVGSYVSVASYAARSLCTNLFKLNGINISFVNTSYNNSLLIPILI